jgi:acyl-CoA synthetase (AMP-forming)/AMP-acid ligase II
VALRNRPEHVAAVLAVLAADRCLTTVNPLQPAERLAADIERADVPVLIADPDLAIPDDPGRALIRLAPDGSMQAQSAIASRETELATATAIEMLTSGTTGPPKRVRLSTRQLDTSVANVAGARGVEDRLPRMGSSVTIVPAPLVHIGGLWNVLNALYSGRRLFLLERFRVPDWVAAVETYRPKSTGLVPAALRSVLDADVDPQRLSSLRAVTSGTARCPVELADEFYDRFGIPVLATYGATEFAGAVAGWTLPDHEKWWKLKRGSVGRPFRGVEIRAVDQASWAPLSAGEPGLLEVRSGQVTSDRSWLRTSDLGRVDSDGFVWIDGRADDVIIRGGFKVQPDTVEKTLRAYPGVLEAAVIGVPHPRLGSVPIAVVELTPGALAPDPGELLAFTRERLMPYEVPVEIRIVDALPRTPSLKISRVDVLALFDPAQPAP